MELRHLRYFVTVAELGSVSRAAQKLFIAQPPLSAQIRQLEEELGVSLFTRQPRGVRLTQAGTSFLEDARAILARAQQAAVRARERQAGQRATLRLGLVPSTIHSVLPGLLQRLVGEKLAVNVEVREMITTQQLQALHNREIDLGLARPGEGSQPAEMVACIDDPYCLAMPLGNPLARSRKPLALREAARERFVSFSRYQDADYYDRTAALCIEAGFTPDIRHEAGQFVNRAGHGGLRVGRGHRAGLFRHPAAGAGGLPSSGRFALQEHAGSAARAAAGAGRLVGTCGRAGRARTGKSGETAGVQAEVSPRAHLPAPDCGCLAEAVCALLK